MKVELISQRGERGNQEISRKPILILFFNFLTSGRCGLLESGVLGDLQSLLEKSHKAEIETEFSWSLFSYHPPIFLQYFLLSCLEWLHRICHLLCYTQQSKEKVGMNLRQRYSELEQWYLSYFAIYVQLNFLPIPLFITLSAIWALDTSMALFLARLRSGIKHPGFTYCTYTQWLLLPIKPLQKAYAVWFNLKTKITFLVFNWSCVLLSQFD